MSINIKSFIAFSLLAVSLFFASSPAHAAKTPDLGVWITVFSDERVLESKENVEKALDTCENSGITDIYLQLYRGDKAYYNSSITDRSPYEALKAKAKLDPVRYMIDSAHKRGIRVHAWLNMLCVSQNADTNITRKFGDEVLTKDQHGRTPLITPAGKGDNWDKYYMREDQLFLEPGDERVRKYVVSIAEEVVARYPGFDGLHLDYIRYPAAVPFVPGSRFASHGLYYGYTPRNIAAFKKATGLDPRTMEGSQENFWKWDSWHRQNVTAIVRECSQKARAISPSIKVSCTTVASPERTYYVTGQEWTKWLKDRIVDYITPMNYSVDPVIVELNSRSMIFTAPNKEVQMGIGAYLLKEKPEVLKAEIKAVKALDPRGVIIFSYDDIAKNKSLQSFLLDEFGE